MILFMATVWELVMSCVWVNGLKTTASGAIDLRNIWIIGVSTGISQLFVILIARGIFRYGNYRYHKYRSICGIASTWLVNMLIYAGFCWLTVAYGRCFGDQAVRFVIVVVGFGGGSGCGGGGGGIGSLFRIDSSGYWYARQTRDMLMSWSSALGITWLAIEPLSIVFFVVLPAILGVTCVEGCVERMQELGIDMALFM